ncbi:MAG: hypothetical protein Q9187_006156 [Circinaria calcarea]
MYRAVASAVILPEPVDQPFSPTVKRRLPSFTEGPEKRPKIKSENSPDSKSPSLALRSDVSERRKSGQMEERKRGQRLFGALLGTLSQSSSSTAHKRRVDIERKQQAKLRSQAEEYDEKKKQKLEALLDVRRQEQKKYNKQSMQIRHSNLLAMAQFLKTKAEPSLYYKPWELLPGDKDIISAQVVEAEALIDSETAAYNDEEISEDTRDAVAIDNDTTTNHHSSENLETVGPEANQPAPDDSLLRPANPDRPTMTGDIQAPHVATYTSKDQGDDGGEVVFEADEDTVIY